MGMTRANVFYCARATVFLCAAIFAVRGGCAQTFSTPPATDFTLPLNINDNSPEADEPEAQSPSVLRDPRYELALSLFCNYRLKEAIAHLDQLLLAFPDDGPSMLLRGRAVSALSSSEQEFSREWV